MGLLDAIFGSNEKEPVQYDVKQVPTSTPEQQELLKSLTSYVSQNATKTAQPYAGQLNAPISPTQIAAREKFTTLSKLAEKGLEPLLTGNFTPQLDEAFNNSVANPLISKFKQDILPTVQEQFIGSGTFDGSPRGLAVGRATSDLTGQIASERGKLMRDVTFAPLTATGLVSNLTATQEALGQEEQRIEQSKLTSAFAEFQRTRPENSPWLNIAIQTLGLGGGFENIVSPYNDVTTEGAGNEFGAALAGGTQGAALGPWGAVLGAGLGFLSAKK